jgi:hypothetical protein
MDVNDIKEIVFSINTESYRNQEINFKFVYNSYHENETTIQDNVILDREVSRYQETKNKFVRINFENTVVNNENANIINTNIDIIEDIINPLTVNDIYAGSREYFNKIDNLIPSRYNLISDNKFNDYKNYIDLYSFNEGSSLSTSFNNNDRSNRISIRKDEDYIENFKTKEYVENFNYSNLKDYESLINNENVVLERKNAQNYYEKFKTGNLFPGLVFLSKTVNFGDIESYADFNGVNCGYYIEKHVKKENQTYEFLCGRFFKNINKSSQFSGIIEDEAIQYGKEYRYIVYNTYFFTSVDPENRFMLRHYLLCSYPYMSNDIVCKEFNRPLPPVDIMPTYDIQNKKMTLRWDSPLVAEGDVKGFQILRRYSIQEPFSLVKQLEGHLPSDFYEPEDVVGDNFIIKTPGKIPDSFIDESYDENKMTIYTIRSIDAHGMISDCSVQIGVYYDFMRNKLISNIISERGADINFPNTELLNKSFFMQDEADIVDNLPTVKNPKKFSLYITPDFGYIINNGSRTRVLGEKYQFTFSNLNNTIFRSDIFTIDNFG